MANVNLAAQKIGRGTGTAATYTTVNATDVYFVEATTGTEFIEIVGDAAQSRTITITPAQKVDGLSLPNVTVTVGANATFFWGAIDSGIYSSGGRMQVTASGACKLGVFRI